MIGGSTALSVTDLVYVVNGKPIVQCKQFTVKSGEIAFCLGNTGSGKSTLGKILCGLLPQTEYPDILCTTTLKAYLRGTKEGNITPHSKALYIPTDPETFLLYPNVADELLSWMNTNERETTALHAQFIEALTYVGLSERHLFQEINQLSGGERLRLVFACVFLARPALIVWDETLCWLDDASKELMVNLIEQIRIAGGISVILDNSIAEYSLEINQFIVISSGIVSPSISPLVHKSLRSHSPSDYEQKMPLRDSPTPVVSVKHLNHEVRTNLGTLELFDSLSFQFVGGDCVHVQGPNGSGKSTLARCLAGLEKSRAGVISIAGQTVANIPAHQRPSVVGLISQFPDHQFIFNWLIDEFKVFGYDAALMDVIGSLPNAPIHSMTPFQQRCILLAIVLAKRPKVLILDEPTWGLDDDEKNQLYSILKWIKQITEVIIILSHNKLFASAICNRTLHINQPKLKRQ